MCYDNLEKAICNSKFFKLWSFIWHRENNRIKEQYYYLILSCSLILFLVLFLSLLPHYILRKNSFGCTHFASMDLKLNLLATCQEEKKFEKAVRQYSVSVCFTESKIYHSLLCSDLIKCTTCMPNSFQNKSGTFSRKFIIVI